VTGAQAVTGPAAAPAAADVSGGWLYLAVASLHLPGIAILAFLLRNLADSDPPDVSEDSGAGGGGPPRGWRWRRRPHRRGDGPAARRSRAARRT
jgi:hypothetical protein